MNGGGWFKTHGYDLMKVAVGASVPFFIWWATFYGDAKVTARDVEVLKCRVPVLEEKITTIDKEVSSRLASIDEQLKSIREELRTKR